MEKAFEAHDKQEEAEQIAEAQRVVDSMPSVKMFAPAPEPEPAPAPVAAQQAPPPLPPKPKAAVPRKTAVKMK